MPTSLNYFGKLRWLDGGQVKRSFPSKEPAVTAGAVIKKASPIVVVSVVDTEEQTTEIVNA